MARMQGETTTDICQHFAGIDVTKAHLDLRLSCERRPAAKPPPSEGQLRLKASTTSIADRIDRRATLKGQRAEARDPLIARFDEAEIAQLSDAIDALKAFKQRLKAKGKSNGVILTAILRKLIILANALVAQNRKWTPKSP